MTSGRPVVRLRYTIVLAIVFLIMISGCISYYKPDPFAGVDFARKSRRVSVGASINRYHADDYFDGSDKTPHAHQTERLEYKYIREDILLTSTVNVSDWWGITAILPVSHVFQRGSPYHEIYHNEPGVWGVEHFWLGANVSPVRDKHVSFLFGIGIPLAGRLGTLRLAAANHNSSTRLTFQTIFSNGMPDDRFGYYLRLGFGGHDYSDDSLHGIYELPGELRLGVPLPRRISAGVALEAKFTLYEFRGGRKTECRDAGNFGPFIEWRYNDYCRIHAGYRTEIFGNMSSAGTFWNIGMTYDLWGRSN